MELVRIAMQAYGAGDYEILLALADPMMRWDERQARPDGELVWGHDDVLRTMIGRRDRWRDYGFEFEELIDAGDGGVVAVYSERGRAADGAAPVEERHAALWSFEGPRIVGCSVYLTKEEALRAAAMAAAEAASSARAKPPGAAGPPKPRKGKPANPRNAAAAKPRKAKPAQAAGRPDLRPGSDQWVRRQQAARRRAALRRAAQQRKAS